MTDLACLGAPDTCAPGTTIAHVLQQRRLYQPEDRAFRFLDDNSDVITRTWGQLDAGARAVAAALRELRTSHEQPRALLLLPQDSTFLDALFGCFYAGVCAVPAHVPNPSRLAQTLPRLQAIVAEAQPQVVLTTHELLAARALVPELAATPCIAVDELDGRDAEVFEVAAGADDLAILQYSSGSTGSPRGVMVSHRNLMANEALIQNAFEHGSSTVVLGWLPFQHDMGLIGNVLQPVFSGAECVMMTPLQFLKHPLRWLREISRHGVTTSGAPNFAYDMCVAAVQRQGATGLHELDLSRWNLAFVGAEPVRAATLDRFAATFSGVGFRREAFYPCYGLAEATLMVTGGQRDESPGVWRDGRGVDRVSCGRARDGLEVAIVDEAGETRCPDGVEGEIWVRGSSVAQGYFGKQQASEETFGAVLDGTSWLRTGDRGCLVADELYVTGRDKDIVVRNGVKYAAEDLEHTVEQLHVESLHPNGCASFGHDDGSRERLVVVAEIARGAEDAWDDVADRIVGAIAAEHGAPPDEVAFVKRGGIPRTTSGKMRRGELRALYGRDELAEVHRYVLGRSA
ncbi:fatty acyl-AMP ligase [Mycobacterium paraterrae]|uniref:Fatty acyl-AMP ligase n=1 Tax=Mycobacterium paraterrae TaxID=577492 RepID=A0ABY3VQ31_9MYCO|nr:fatty acyl-AMP ligase [Mycobacterium paraterrae]UMB70722.1 fatty acyl-AMP ligase [Mycobacterium paraterrae]